MPTPLETLEAYCSAATSLAREAGAFALAHFRTNIAVEHKSLGDVVTEVDRANEQMLRRGLTDRFPQTAVLGEEYGGAYSTDDVWIVDPVDGTTNYTRGIPHWCVSVGLMRKGQPTVGVIYDPCHDELFSAIAGHGAKLNGTPITCSKTETIGTSLICVGLTRTGNPAVTSGHVAALSQDGASVRSQGAGALTLAHLAAGRVDAFFEHGIHVWDVAAAALILSEAGGRLAHRFDPAAPKDGFPLLGATPGLFADLCERLAFSEANGFHAAFA